MRFLDYIKLAFKNIWRRKLRSFLTVVSIVIGALAVVSVLTLIFGAKSVFIKQLEAEGSFTKIYVTPNQENLDSGGPFGNDEQVSDNQKKIDDKVIENLKNIPHVIDANASYDAWGLQSIRAKEGDGKRFRAGVEAIVPGKATERNIIAGRGFNEDDGKGLVIIGSDVAERLGFKEPRDAVAKKVIFTTQKGYQGDGADIPGPGSDQKEWDKIQEKITDLEAEIIGVTTPPGPGDRSNIFITMKWGKLINSWSNWKWDEEKGKAYEEKMRQLQEQEMNAKKNNNKLSNNQEDNQKWDTKDCTECFTLQIESQIDKEGYQMVYLKVDDSSNTLKVADDVKGMGLGALTAEDMLKMFTKIANIVAAILAAIGAISLGVATIGIINTMLMAMYERTREIGIMRACGAKRRTIRRLFTFEASALGFLGGAIGIVIGEIIIIIANYYLNKMLSSASMAGQNVISLPLWLIIATIGITTVLGLLSGFYPAFRAAKVDPVEALRFE